MEVKNDVVNERVADNELFVKVRLWKYNPTYFAKKGMVDPISLACSFIGNEDERIEIIVLQPIGIPMVCE